MENTKEMANCGPNGSQRIVGVYNLISNEDHKNIAQNPIHLMVGDKKAVITNGLIANLLLIFFNLYKIKKID
jgi:hypothetical protein